MDRDRHLGLYYPAAVWRPVVAPQTQEIPLLLLHSSVVATCLCVYFCGTDPVCMCQSRTVFFFFFFFRRGGYSTAVPTNRPQSRGTHTRKVKQTQLLPFSQNTSRHSYWLTHETALFVIGPLASPTLLFSLREVWPLNSDPFGKAESSLKGPGERRGSSLECLDLGDFFLHCCPLWLVYRPFSLFKKWESEVFCHPGEGHACLHSLICTLQRFKGSVHQKWVRVLLCILRPWDGIRRLL